jgi:hypothetical protein
VQFTAFRWFAQEEFRVRRRSAAVWRIRNIDDERRGGEGDLRGDSPSAGLRALLRNCKLGNGLRSAESHGRSTWHPVCFPMGYTPQASLRDAGRARSKSWEFDARLNGFACEMERQSRDSRPRRFDLSFDR